jgi:hypothetical protein
MKSMAYLLLVAASLFCLSVKAEDAGSENLLHFTAHFGASYAIDTFAQGFNQKAFKMNNLDSETFAAFTTLFIGAVYEAQENASGHDMLKALGYNALGVGAAVLTRCMFRYEF